MRNSSYYKRKMGQTDHQPLDYHIENRTGAVRLARFYSNLVSPPTIFAAMGISVAFHSMPFGPALFWGVLFGVMLALFPILIILWMIQRGMIAELHMSNTRERRIPYLVSIGMAFLVLALEYIFSLPDEMVSVTLFVILDLVLLFLITLVWLISMHTTAAAAAAGLIFLIWGWFWALVIGAPLVLSVIWNRLYLKRHTPAQAWCGVALGLGSAYLFSLIRGF